MWMKTKNVTPIDAAKSSGTSPSYEELLTAEELAAKLKISPSTVFELTRRRTSKSRAPMPKLKVGKFVRFRLSDVMSWMETNGRAA
jgi:excisionase family DNA binding protein